MKEADVHLSRRERQIMEVIYEMGEASALEVNERLPDPPSYSSVRALLRILENKGHLRHKKKGARYIYLPIRSRHRSSRSALKRLLKTYFQGSVENTVAALLDISETDLTPSELNRLRKLIDQAREERG